MKFTSIKSELTSQNICSFIARTLLIEKNHNNEIQLNVLKTEVKLRPQIEGLIKVEYKLEDEHESMPIH